MKIIEISKRDCCQPCDMVFIKTLSERDNESFSLYKCKYCNKKWEHYKEIDGGAGNTDKWEDYKEEINKDV